MENIAEREAGIKTAWMWIYASFVLTLVLSGWLFTVIGSAASSAEQRSLGVEMRLNARLDEVSKDQKDARTEVNGKLDELGRDLKDIYKMQIEVNKRGGH